jgi:CspA family cold shock protein
LARQLGRFASQSRAHVSDTLQIRVKTELAAKPRARSYVHTVSERTIIMTNGTVKFYNAHKGFGFIQPDDGSRDVFVHATALERAGISTLQEGQKVSFDTQTDARSGKIAVGRLAIA